MEKRKRDRQRWAIVVKKSLQSSRLQQWSGEWYQLASADEMLSALGEAETTSPHDNEMQEFVEHLMWEIRFQMLEDELKRRLVTLRSA